MKKEKVSNFFIIIAIILFLLSISCIGMGFNKMLNYRNSNTSYYSKSVNAYVGGDAYNYIINGNYATAHFVLAVLFAILGIGVLVLAYLKQVYGIPIVQSEDSEVNTSDIQLENET